MNGFVPKLIITKRMTQAITRIERAWSSGYRSETGHFCDNFMTRIAPFQTVKEAA